MDDIDIPNMEVGADVIVRGGKFYRRRACTVEFSRNLLYENLCKVPADVMAIEVNEMTDAWLCIIPSSPFPLSSVTITINNELMDYEIKEIKS